MKKKYDFTYVCNSPVTIDNIDHSGTTAPANHFCVSGSMHQFLRDYTKEHANIHIPDHQKDEIIYLNRRTCLKIWKTMNTHGKEIIAREVKNKFYNPWLIEYELAEEQVIGETRRQNISRHAWYTREIFEKSEGIHIHRHLSGINWHIFDIINDPEDDYTADMLNL